MLSKLALSAKNGRLLMHMRASPLVPYNYQTMFTVQRNLLLQSQLASSSLR